ncbi:MAG: rhomboid family intramembrane serine protease [Anaerolineales bacterium]|nr:rhomboid family intramembrane serine protease [Anaerolineales bacterium]
MLFILVVNLLFGFVGSARIDNWGHIGGLIGGAIVAIGLVPKYEAPAAPAYGVQPLQEVNRRPWEIAWVIGCTVVFVLGVWLANLWYARTI